MRFPKQSDNFKISLGIMDKKLYMYFSIIIIILCTHEKEHVALPYGLRKPQVLAFT